MSTSIMYFILAQSFEFKVSKPNADASYCLDLALIPGLGFRHELPIGVGLIWHEAAPTSDGGSVAMSWMRAGPTL